MKALVIDCETDGLSPQTNRVIEIAIALFDLDHASVIATFAALLEGDSNAAEHINRIPSVLLKHGMAAEDVWAQVATMIDRADFLLAHNAPFDRSFVVLQIPDIKVPWCCSMRDISFPHSSNSKSLTAVALAHGVPIIGAHRALTDVDILCRLLSRLKETGTDLVELFETAMKPKAPQVLVQAMVSYDDRAAAAQKGFIWKPAPLKRWEKRMTLEEAKKLPFKVKVIKEAAATPNP